MITDGKKGLLQTGVFKNESEIVLFLLTREMSQAKGPMGSGILKEKMDQIGIEYGTATIGRYLRSLDLKG